MITINHLEIEKRMNLLEKAHKSVMTLLYLAAPPDNTFYYFNGI